MLIAKRELNVASRGPFRVSFSLPSSLSLSLTHTHTHARTCTRTFSVSLANKILHALPVHPIFTSVLSPRSLRSSRFVGYNPSRIVLAGYTRPRIILLFYPRYGQRGLFCPWLNNDREKDRTFRLKEYRHAAIARSQRPHP